LAKTDEQLAQPEDRGSNTARYAAEALASVAVLLWIYGLTRGQGVPWAIITAILVIQTGLDRSLKASAVRIVATLLGAAVGTAAALSIRDTAAALLVGILVTVVLCYLGRLDPHLRQACLTVPIVQMFHQGSILNVSYERTTAILAGCFTALVIQFAFEGAARLIKKAAPSG